MVKGDNVEFDGDVLFFDRDILFQQEDFSFVGSLHPPIFFIE